MNDSTPELSLVKDASQMPEATEAKEATDERYTTTVDCSLDSLPPDFVEGIRLIEHELGMSVCLFLQDDRTYESIEHGVYEAFFNNRELVSDHKKVALMVHSPGGDPRAAYKLAKLLNATHSGYVALVPRYAKSAATLMSLGAEKIIIGTHAELGPLDMQVGDSESESNGSALNHVQSLERLSAYALDTLDRGMFLLIKRSGKKVASILPHALNFSCAIARPLLENIDVVKYTEMSRILKVGEEYAVRLMARNYGELKAKEIASRLVSDYPEHGFVIDYEEAKELGINVELPGGKVAEGFTKVMQYMGKISAYGTLTLKGD